MFLSNKHLHVKLSVTRALLQITELKFNVSVTRVVNKKEDLVAVISLLLVSR